MGKSVLHEHRHITSLAWWCRPPAVVTTRSGRAAGVPALEMIRAMLLSSDRVEHRGGGGKISNSNYFRTNPASLF
ncbi:hypothetical protein HZB03_00585 [Candidatus Woesearchaeota archaeon]|nr:hypothetical protein [Candidatus Woesearchaeota archaeon]